MPRDGITDEQLLALGRFTWASMKLETWIGRVCRYLVADVTDKGTAGHWVKSLEKRLTNPDAAQARALAWLKEAAEVLDEHRNAILHGQLEAFYFGDHPAPDNLYEWQLMIANERRASIVPFTAVALADREEIIEAVHAAGISIDADLAVRGSIILHRSSSEAPPKEVEI